jgi:hypothetical protein
MRTEGEVLHLYAIADGPPAIATAGIGEVALECVKAGDLWAIFSRHPEPVSPGVEELWQHEEVVEELMEAVTVLPFRFGATVAGEAELKSVLDSRTAEFSELIEAVRGAVELSVRAELAPVEASGNPASLQAGARFGTAYMRQRAEEIERRERARLRLHEPLSELARQSHLGNTGESQTFKAAYLVDGERLGAFTARTQELAGNGVARISCTGPWPPYTFVSRGKSDDRR